MDRCLGAPLPHQLANPTRANPKALNLSPEGHIRYYSPFPEAIPYLWAYSHALLTRAPLSTRPKPCFPFDLHVLSLPPAFVLSQDQTLKFIRQIVRKQPSMTRACPSTFTQLAIGYQTNRKPSNAQNNKSTNSRPAARASLPLHIHNLLELVQTAPSARGVLASWSALIRLLPGPCQTLYER